MKMTIGNFGSEKTVEITEGTRVRYHTFTGESNIATVTETDEDIKNGQPGVDLNDGHWCYADQIEAIA